MQTQKNKTKIILLSIIIMLFANLNVLAQVERKELKSTIVGSVLGNAPNRNYDDKSIGAHLSYRYNSFSEISGINFNAGYIHYKDNEIVKNDYTLTLGSHTNYKIGEYQLNYNANTEVGIIYKDIEKNKIRLLLSFSTGAYYHIYKNFGIEINFKVQYNTYDLYHCGIGAGIFCSF